MPLTVEQLMAVRYKVIADYPYSPYKAGQIITPNTGSGLHILLKGFPNIFSDLEWWQEREVSEMPEYVVDSNGSIFKAKWTKGVVTENGQQPMRMRLVGQTGDWQVIENIMCFYELPTQQKFNDYINKQK